MQWLSALIALPALAYSASPFFISAGRALSNWRMNMDTPISLAIALASSMSLFETWQNGQHVYFDAALALTFFLLAGRYFDEKTRTVARSAAEELAALEPSRAIRLDSGAETEVPVDAVRSRRPRACPPPARGFPWTAWLPKDTASSTNRSSPVKAALFRSARTRLSPRAK